MKKNTQIIAWVFYLLAVIILFFGLVFRFEHKLLYMSYSCVLLTVPWIICILNSFKPKNNSIGLWPFFLFFVGLIAIPLYLIRIQKNKKSLA
jgi:predicted ferric reductase